jgi:predicted AlkP superfamily phosphohydrolase/phosphomutase
MGIGESKITSSLFKKEVKKMTIYILNSLIVPINFDKYKKVQVKLERISPEEAKEILKNHQFISAIGHEGTSKLLTDILGVNIPTNRTSVYFEPGDTGIHFFLKERLPEGKVLSKEELEKLQYWIVKSSVQEVSE